MKQFSIFAILFLVLMPFIVSAADDPKDVKACEEARKESKEKIFDGFKVWESYLEKFPHGTCYSEAINNIKISGRGSVMTRSYQDEKNKEFFSESIAEYHLNSCAKTPTESVNIFAHDGNGNSVKADVYVDDNKIGTTPGEFKVPGCSFKLILRANNKYFYKKLNLQGGFDTTFINATLQPELQWSKKATKVKSPENYCKNLKEGGHKDWRLPTIDDFKTAIKCPSKLNGGNCEFYIKSYKSVKESSAETKFETKGEEVWISSAKGAKISFLEENKAFVAVSPDCPVSDNYVMIKRAENGEKSVYFQSVCLMDGSKKKEKSGDYDVRCVR